MSGRSVSSRSRIVGEVGWALPVGHTSYHFFEYWRVASVCGAIPASASGETGFQVSSVTPNVGDQCCACLKVLRNK